MFRADCRLIRLLALAASLFTVAPLSADWIAESIQPPGANSTSCRATDGVRHGGAAHIANQWRAFHWAAGGTVDLHFPAASESFVYAIAGPRQVGVARIGGAQHAGYWTGSAASWVDLHPAAATDSIAYAAHGERQAGLVRWPGDSAGTVAHAAIWSGTAQSLLDIHPTGANRDSWINAMGPTRQAGYVDFRAGMWAGTAASYVNLHPPGVAQSNALCIAEDEFESVQAGFTFSSDGAHAALWRGSRESWVDLHPPGASDSYVFGTSMTHQCGYARVGGYARACVWQGTVDSYVDLHALLPARFIESYAQAIATTPEGQIVIIGDAYDPTLGRNEAMRWTTGEGSAPCPADLNNDGSVGLGDLTVLLSAFGSVASPPVDISGNGTVGLEDLTVLLGSFGSECP